jgi:cobalamin biosynthetic protein CobC
MSEPTLVHGGALARMRALFPDAPEPWIDLSTGINPWPYPVTAATLSHFSRLPDADLFAASRAAMAQTFGAAETAVLPAPGSEALIRLLPRLIPACSVALREPTYGDHSQAWRAAGARIEALDDPLSRAGAVDVLVIVNPNNPDGRTVAPAALIEAHAAQAARGGWLIVDEAFADLDPSLSVAAQAGPGGLVILRSFGKFYGLAGLRLGAMLGPPDLLAAAADALGAWAVNGPALAIGRQAYGDAAWSARTRARLAKARGELDLLLSAAQLPVSGGTDLFRFVATADATGLWRRLGQAGIAVRRFSWSDARVRIGLPASNAELARLASALQDHR